MATLAIVGIVYGAFVTLVQTDFKKLIAYSSVSPPGLRAARRRSPSTWQGMKGAVLQMINHGVSTGALFLLVGIDLRARTTRA